MDISRRCNKIIPFRQHLASDKLLLDSASQIVVERSFNVITFLIEVYIDFESRRSCGILRPIDSVLYREQRLSTPTACDLRKVLVLNRVLFGAIWRIMHQQYILSCFVCKIHKVLLYNLVIAEIGTSSIAKNNNSPRMRILVNPIAFPCIFYIVTNEFGCIMSLPNGHITNIPLYIIDSVQDDFALGEVGKVMVKGLGLATAYHCTLTLEVTDEFFLLGVYADNWNSGFNTLLSCLGNDLELLFPILYFCGSEAFYKGTLAKSKHIKHLRNYVFEYFNFLFYKFLLYLRLLACNPIDIFILLKPCRVVMYNGLNFMPKVGLFVYPLCAASAFPTYPVFVGIILFFYFTNTCRNCFTVKSKELGDSRDSFVPDFYGAGAKVTSSLRFVEGVYEVFLILGKHIWGMSRNLLDYTDLTPKGTNIFLYIKLHSIVYQYIILYLILCLWMDRNPFLSQSMETKRQTKKANLDCREMSKLFF